MERHKVYPLRSDADLRLYKPEYHMAKPSTAMLHKELAKFFEPLGVEFDSDLLQTAVRATMILDEDARYPVQAVTYDQFVEKAREMNNDRTNAGTDALGSTHHEYIMQMGEGDEERGIAAVSARAWHLYRVIIGELKGDAEDAEELVQLR
jgi:hypothetical protein